VREEENDTAVMMSLLSRCATAAEVVTLLDAVEGPHAFVYWQVRTRRTQCPSQAIHRSLNVVLSSRAQAASKRLFFGKDKLGRRSLVLHRPASLSDPFILSSVAVLPLLESTPAVPSEPAAKPDKERRYTGSARRTPSLPATHFNAYSVVMRKRRTMRLTERDASGRSCPRSTCTVSTLRRRSNALTRQ
jgi:hypothetical protein